MNETFNAVAPDDFRKRMIEWWMRDEGFSEELAIAHYGGYLFDNLCERLIGKTREYVSDCHANEGGDETCFEVADNNYVIPTSILVRHKQIQGGQKRPYGASYNDFIVNSDLPAEQVEVICTTLVYGCKLKHSTWAAENKSADNYFRNHYKFEKRSDGSYFYSVISPYTG